jgi:hypothetical protein
MPWSLPVSRKARGQEVNDCDLYTILGRPILVAFPCNILPLFQIVLVNNLGLSPVNIRAIRLRQALILEIFVLATETDLHQVGTRKVS